MPTADEAPAPLVRLGSAQANAQQDHECPSADRAFHAALARFSAGISPNALLLAYTDWLSHLAVSPQRQLEISQEAVQNVERLFQASQQFFDAAYGP